MIPDQLSSGYGPLLLWLWCLLASHAQAHPYHTSFAEVDWNLEGSALEVALRVLPEDLETALTWRRGEAVVLGQNHQEATITAYLQDHFQVYANGAEQAAALHFAGLEVAYDEAWLYFEVSVSPEQRLSLRNSLLLEVDRSQTNRVQALWAAPGATLVFTATETEQTLWQGR